MKKNRLQNAWKIGLLVNAALVVLTGMFLMLYGFVLHDVREIPVPDSGPYRLKYVEPELTGRQREIDTQLRQCNSELAQCNESNRNFDKTAETLQRTIKQLLDAKAESKLVEPALNEFLSIQQRQAENNRKILQLTETKQALENEAGGIRKQVSEQEERGWKEYRAAYERYQMRFAFSQLAILVPLLLLSCYLCYRYRGRLPFKVLLAFAAATLIRTGLTMHQYFPSRCIKYVMIGAVIAILIWFVVHLLRLQIKPKIEYLLKKYREAYHFFVCPICNYPIRNSVRRFLFWTPRSLAKETVPTVRPNSDNGVYVCPNCGERLFEKCSVCGKVRHALLPYCEHCGAEKQVTGV